MTWRDDETQRRERVQAMQAELEQHLLDALYRERYGPDAVAPTIHPVRPGVESATLPHDSRTTTPQNGPHA